MGSTATYTKKKTQEIRKLTEAGEVVTYYRIWATSKGGTYFHVDIPDAELGKADAALTKKAQELDAI